MAQAQLLLLVTAALWASALSQVKAQQAGLYLHLLLLLQIVVVRQIQCCRQMLLLMVLCPLP
jgi:hypothetical protein